MIQRSAERDSVAIDLRSRGWSRLSPVWATIPTASRYWRGQTDGAGGAPARATVQGTRAAAYAERVALDLEVPLLLQQLADEVIE